MTTLQRIAVVVGLVMGLSAAPVALWAAEHSGTALGGGKEGGAVRTEEGSHGMKEADEADEDEAVVLQEAAAALRKGESRPDLAAKLEQMAKEESK